MTIIFDQIISILKYSSLYCKEFITVNFETFKNLEDSQHNFEIVHNEDPDKLSYFQNYFNKMIDVEAFYNTYNDFVLTIKDALYKKSGYYNNLSYITLKILEIFVRKCFKNLEQ